MGKSNISLKSINSYFRHSKNVSEYPIKEKKLLVKEKAILIKIGHGDAVKWIKWK